MNAHGVCMKGIAIGEKDDGKSKGISPLLKPKEFKHNILKRQLMHSSFYV